MEKDAPFQQSVLRLGGGERDTAGGMEHELLGCNRDEGFTNATDLVASLIKPLSFQLLTGRSRLLPVTGVYSFVPRSGKSPPFAPHGGQHTVVFIKRAESPFTIISHLLSQSLSLPWR